MEIVYVELLNYKMICCSFETNEEQNVELKYYSPVNKMCQTHDHENIQQQKLPKSE